MKSNRFLVYVTSLMLLCGFAVTVPTGCVMGPDGKVQLDPNAHLLLKQVAKAAVIIGITKATAGVSELVPYKAFIIDAVNQSFARNDAPKDIAKSLQQTFNWVALEIGSEEIYKILNQYTTEALTPSIPGAAIGGEEQYQFNLAIVDNL